MNRKELNKKAIKTAGVSIFINLVLAIVKGVTGVVGNSFALIADAIESTTDIFSSILVLLGLKYSLKPADENHPYGHGKIEPLITFIVVVFLLCSASYIVYEAVHNINTPHEGPSLFTLWIIAAIIIVKEFSYRFVKRSGDEVKSTALIADAWHHRSDALTSLAAFIGILLAIVLGEGYENLDDWAALLAAAFIAFNAFLIFRPALGEIMDEHLHDDMILEIRKIAKSVPKVMGTEKCFIRKSGMNYFIDLHLEVDGDMSVYDSHKIAHELKSKIINEIPQIADVLIHVEPSDHK